MLAPSLHLGAYSNGTSSESPVLATDTNTLGLLALLSLSGTKVIPDIVLRFVYLFTAPVHYQNRRHRRQGPLLPRGPSMPVARKSNRHMAGPQKHLWTG